jgi:hypothetical protein
MIGRDLPPGRDSDARRRPCRVGREIGTNSVSGIAI